MKRLLLQLFISCWAICLLFISCWAICSWANSHIDSLIIYPKPAKNMININKIGNETIKFNLFLFGKDGHLVKSCMDTNQIYVNDITNGEYVLVIIEDNKPYRFFINVEN